MQGVQGFDFDHPNRIAIFVALAILGFVGLIYGQNQILERLA
jgi:hypothetical protein